MSVRLWAPDAFPSFATLADFEQMASFLGGPMRPRSRRTPKPARQYCLPRVVCAHLDAAGRPCGNRLHPVNVSPTQCNYRSTVCSESGHEAGATRMIEAPVLAALAARFTPEALSGVVDRAWLEASATRRTLPQLKEKVSVAKSYIQAARDAEYEARVARDGDAQQEAKARIHRYRQELLDAEEGLRAFESDAGRITALAAADRAKVLALATDLSALFARAADEPTLVAQLVATLCREVRVRRDVKGVATIGVVYMTGNTEWLQLHTIVRWASQPERAYLRGRLAEGADVAAVAAELNAHGRGGPRPEPVACRRDASHSWPLWTASRVTTVATQWATAPREVAWCSPEPRVKGRGTPVSQSASIPADERYAETGPGPAPESAAALAARLEVPVTVVWWDALRGVLGDAAYLTADPDATHGEVSNRLPGMLAVWPTEVCLHRTYPEYARRCVAREAGWPPADTVHLRAAALQFGRAAETLMRRLRHHSGVRRDAHGRVYGRTSELSQVLPGVVYVRKAGRDRPAESS